MKEPKQPGLETDSDGNIVSKPVMGWVIAPFAGMATILRIQYATNQAELQSGGRWIQLALTPEQSLQLAERLTTLAKKILDEPSAQTH